VTNVEDSILTSTKIALDLAPDYTAFDDRIVMHINSVFSTLNQLGIGPTEGFMIEDESAVWGDFLTGNMHFNNMKTYMFLRVKLLFDPPGTSYLISMYERQIEQLEWRLNVEREGTQWIDPQVELSDDILILDGGSP
jgi:hypothetical protein